MALHPQTDRLSTSKNQPAKMTAGDPGAVPVVCRLMRTYLEEETMTTPVAGIGASAGGLEAFKLLLTHLPPDTGLAFVFIQHLDPKHHSNLAEILAKGSPIPVQQAGDGMEIEPNRLYVIPPDAGLEIAGPALRITQRAPASAGPHMPIDRFLRSLAQECGSRSIGIILSGAGTDGAAGLEAVKEAGGVTFVQDPATAKFSGMPQAARDRGAVDFVLPLEGIAAELPKLSHHPYIAEDEDTGSGLPASGVQDHFAAILALLHKTTGVDFAAYRESAVRRRILRRLALRSIASLMEYRAQLENDPHEQSALQRDLLISVTCFFRDPESFENLKKLVFPRLVQRRAEDAAIRIWVPGCATGEEAYSIAILLQEYLEKTGRAFSVQIFASDISFAAVERARIGKYPESIAVDVSPERLNRYFSKVEGGYEISKALREMCIFSRHDLIQDPPFSKLDLICCRYVLIFFGAARKNVIARFRYALKPGGFLVLGASEADVGNSFSIVEASEELAQGDYVRLEVSDTGCGISAETQARVFDPFFTTKLAGHGLGLAVVRGIVRALGGAIRIVSAPGKGTAVQILLPCAEQRATETSGTDLPASKETQGVKEATILVVEDEDLLREAILKSLRKVGFMVLEASNGSAALDLIRTFKDPIEMLLLDITLPGTSSRQVFEEAKRLRPFMRVIVSSAYSEETAVTWLMGRFQRFIRKPYRLDLLTESIREVLSS